MSVTEEFMAADLHWFFPPPMAHSSPLNTEELFKQYVTNPLDFENYKLSNEYFAIRYTDLKKDMEKIKNSGQTKENVNKYYYYLGMVNLLKQILTNVPITPQKK